ARLSDIEADDFSRGLDPGRIRGRSRAAPSIGKQGRGRPAFSSRHQSHDTGRLSGRRCGRRGCISCLEWPRLNRPGQAEVPLYGSSNVAKTARRTGWVFDRLEAGLPRQTMSTSDDLIVVSNRLPITVRTTATGCSREWSGGGLVGAPNPVLQKKGGCWVGWTGTDYHETLATSLDGWSSQKNYSIDPVFLTPAEKASY